MPRLLLVVLLALIPFVATAQQNAVVPGNSPLAACRNGAWLGPYDPVTGLYDWACIDRNWSGTYGGMNAGGESQYFTPTTRGGNSWILKCTGDGTASNGTAQEGTICLRAGEEIKMYADADVMLASDWVRPGGKLYGDGMYHQRYCGQNEGRIPNGCPITRRSPTHQTRKMTFAHGIMLEGRGKDVDGPHSGGRSSTWIIQDVGGDTNNSGPLTPLDVTDPGGTAGYQASHWAMVVGLRQNTPKICSRPPGSSACDTRTTIVRDHDAEPFARFGRADSLILENIENPGGLTGPVRVCVENRVANGVCSADPRILCTVNDGTARGADGVSGGCSVIGAGSCIGVATALSNLIVEKTNDTLNGSGADEGVYAVIGTFSQAAQGSPTQRASTGQSFLGLIEEVSATTCSAGNGRYVEFGGFWDNQSAFAGGAEGAADWSPLALPVYLFASNPSRFNILTAEELFNQGGGISGVNVMPGSWFNRRSRTAAASCGSPGAPYGIACDDMEQVAIGAGLGGGIYDSTWWYGGGGNNAFSKIDGATDGLGMEIKRNLFTFGVNLQSDASGWLFEDNEWIGNNGNATGIVYASFSPGFRMFRDKFSFNAGYSMISFQGANEWIIRDVELSSNYGIATLFDFRGARNGLVDGVFGHGNRGGPPFSVNALAGGWEIFNVDVRNAYLSNQQIAFNGTFQPHALVAVEDSNGGGGIVSGPVTFENIHGSVHGDENWCAVFMAGGSGDDSAGNGSGTSVDDVRDKFTFKNITLETVDATPTGTFQATCLGDWNGSEEEPPLPTFATSEGGMPSWEGIRVNGVLYPDSPRTSMTAAQAGDCDGLLQGTVVTVHDMPTANTCTDGTNDGILDGGTAAPNQNTVTCKCTPGGTPKWAPL